MLTHLFADQRRYLNSFFEKIDVEQIDRVLQTLLACRGTLILTGVGKSGHIAQKVVATLISTGTRARFLSPGGALHGDIGCLSDLDLLIVFSKSGESRELVDLLPHVQKRGVKTIAVVSREHSTLSENCDEVIILPVEKELCPYNLVPTTSAVIQLIFGDCLAIALMKAKQFTKDDLALNHPAGLIGKKITKRVADVMLTGDSLPLCSPEALLIDVLHELSSKRCGCLLVVDGERALLGIFTDGDLRRSLEKKGQFVLQEPIGHLMTHSAKVTFSDVLLWDAMKQMEEDAAHPITVLPVVDGQRVIGLLRMHDILQRL